MLRKVLVANRGEIACRVIRTLRRLGIASVAVYSDADGATPAVRQADEAVLIGAAPPAASYLDADAILSAAGRTGADAVHPGYGFLAERASFARAVEDAGVVFVGPTPDQLACFGAKHEARALACRLGVPLLPSSGLLANPEEAVAEAERIGFPVLLKATAGGGGIGMRVCRDHREVAASFAPAEQAARTAFGDGRLYLERFLSEARHVEVQVVGDGSGRVITLGDRDCSLQRRHQKVVEEAPAPGLPDQLRLELAEHAQRLCTAVAYRSVGTVEFLVEPATSTIAFLEVNARLQVEHTVTEEIHGIDLVEWMLRLAAGETSMLARPPRPTGHAIEVRVCAENPWRDHQPSAVIVTRAQFGSRVRVDTWIEAGAEVSTHYDSLLAKVVAVGATRDAAIAGLTSALAVTEIDGPATNLDLLRAVMADDRFRAGGCSTGMLAAVRPAGRIVEVVAGGTQTTVQDVPGRLGLWRVGVPPSGAMDDLSFRLGNQVLGNPEGAPGLEMVGHGPDLLFHTAATVCLAGAPTVAEQDGTAVPPWTPVEVGAGSRLRVGEVGPPGRRAYLLFRGGLAVAPTLGSAATFVLGGMGGPGGRAVRAGDLLRLAAEPTASNDPSGVPAGTVGPAPIGPAPMGRRWQLAVLEGPHADGEFLTDADLEAFYATEWKVHHNSDRTGVRLLGPVPRWARPDGGEAGLHPSNIHDTAYAVGAVDFTGDMPILLGPDGPSLGGFVCPAVVCAGERWKLGQLRPGDVVTFLPVAPEAAAAVRVATRGGRASGRLTAQRDPSGGVLGRWEADGARPAVTWRRSGDDYLLVEYGPMVLDLGLRFRVAALDGLLHDQPVEGIVDLTPGIRSLQVHYDPDRLPEATLLRLLEEAEEALGSTEDAEVDGRIVHLPLSWDDPATRLATERYASTVRSDAPWCPWNIEFIRRINGLDDVADVHRIVFDASYLVLGLGDVYLGAPVATPLDPRHRLVTTKYNPARTWTPENAVGIGGAYLCIYGMEGPGGYQFVGRTIPVWNRFRAPAAYQRPWLLRFFDQIRFFEVGADELLALRRDVLVGRAEVAFEPTTLRLAEYQSFCRRHRPSVEEFRARQQSAFAAERARWQAAPLSPPPDPEATGVPDGALAIEAAMAASVWRVVVEEGQRLDPDDPVVVLESMKMETVVRTPVGGRVARLLVRPGQEVEAGQPLVAVLPGLR